MGKESGKSPFHEPDPKFRPTERTSCRFFKLALHISLFTFFLNVLNKE